MNFIRVAVVCLILLTSCKESMPPLPGEEEFKASVGAAEEVLQEYRDKADAVTVEICGDMQNYYDAGVSAFEKMLPLLKGFGIRSRDMKLQQIKDFVEERC